MNEIQQAQAFITTHRHNGLVLQAEVPSKFFDSAYPVDATGIISIKNGIKGRNITFALTLPHFHRELQSRSSSPTFVPTLQPSSGFSKDKTIDFCVCDAANICEADAVVTDSLPVLRVCVASIPSSSRLSVTFSALVHSKDLPVPELEIFHDEVEENKAVIYAQLLPEVFEDQPAKLTLYVRGDIFGAGTTKGQAAIEVPIDLRASTKSPTASPSTTFTPTGEQLLGVSACLCNQESNSCLKDQKLLFGLGDIESCIL